ncbi:MAG: nucleoside hydrolase [Clostridiales bacterium]|nr:nucleoside hydrolase [Clostridiales bacterium]
MEKKKVILDVDTGTDDAIAIMTAVTSENLEVLGVCAVNGNRGIDFTTENTLRVVEYLGKDIPVFRGCSLPMVVSLTEGRREDIPYKGPKDPQDNVHGDYIDLPPATIQEQPVSAVRWLVDTLMASEGDITLIRVGPLTNIAMALRIEPRIAQKIKRIVIMGGGCREVNITPAAEFNFWIDPEAAKIVFDCGCDILVVPLDATHAAAVSIRTAEALERKGTKPATLTARIIRQRQNAYKHWQPMADIDSVPVHDALAVCAVLDESVLGPVVETYADVDIGKGAADGMSIFDLDNRYKDRKKNVKVALGADPERFADMLLNIL